LLLPGACSSQSSIRSDTRIDAELPPSSSIQNLRQLTPTLYSGGQPKTTYNFQQLADLGIRTIISVDAVAPDPELADHQGIRVVHLPIGYDGIDPARTIEFAAAIQQLEHPIFLNCHHGTQRAPAALCAGAIGADLITAEEADRFMKAAGTSQEYPGLWDAVRHSKPLDQSVLESSIEFPARASVSGFIEGMAQLGRLHDELWDLAEDNWNASEYHPDRSASAVIGELYDHMRTLRQLDFFKQKGTMLRTRFEESTELANKLETEIIARNYPLSQDTLDALSASCTQCHTRFRD
jgi:protein tyrosine phosphatase (PTP) superfamily phosphohydrolase (DUF442 family)